MSTAFLWYIEGSASQQMSWSSAPYVLSIASFGDTPYALGAVLYMHQDRDWVNYSLHFLPVTTFL